MEMEIDFEKESVAEVMENQISFDFLLQPETEEEVNSDTQQLMQTENYEWVADETLVLIAKADNSLSHTFDICGKQMIDWVKLATSGCKQKIINCPEEDNILEEVKKEAESFKFVALFYSDTPCLQKATFLEIMDFFSKRKMNVLKLKRGYVFRSEYLQSARMLLSSSVEDFGKEDFVVIDDAQKVALAFKTLQKRILEYHKQQGVVFFGENTIFIDADVEIEEGAVVYPNNIIKGESYVGKNVILESGNYIIDTIICDEAFVQQSYLQNCKVEKGKVIGPFAKIINQQV